MCAATVSSPTVHLCRTPLQTCRAERFNKDEGRIIHIDPLSALKVVFTENDYTLLCQKKPENPDFLEVSIWHDGYEAQRYGLDVIATLTEDSTDDFFAHAMSIDIILEDLRFSKAVPDAHYFQKMRVYGAAEWQKMFEAEAKATHAGEPLRLIRAKIERLLPKVGGTLKKDEALRFIRLEALQIANIITLSDYQAVALLKKEMQKVMNNECGAPGIDDLCIRDLISIFSHDLGSDYWRQPSFLDTVCNNKKREYIAE